MNNTERWASQIIDELFDTEDSFEDQNPLFLKKTSNDELKANILQAGISKERQNIQSENTEAFPARTLNDHFISPSPLFHFKSLTSCSSPLPIKLDFLNKTKHHNSPKYLGCKELDEGKQHQASLKKEKMYSGDPNKEDINLEMHGEQVIDNNNGLTGIPVPLGSLAERVAYHHGDSESENSISFKHKTVENIIPIEYEFWSGDSLLRKEASDMSLDLDAERDIIDYKIEVIVKKFRKLGHFLEICLVTPMASFIASHSEFLEFCLALLFCTLYTFIWPKKSKTKTSFLQIQKLTPGNSPDLNSNGPTVTRNNSERKDGELDSSSKKTGLVIQDKDQDSLQPADIDISLTSYSSLNTLREKEGKFIEETQGSTNQVILDVSSIYNGTNLSSRHELVKNSTENLSLDEASNLTHSSQDCTTDFERYNLHDGVGSSIIDSEKSSNLHGEISLLKQLSGDEKMPSSECLEKTSGDPHRENAKLEEAIPKENDDNDSLEYSVKETEISEISKTESNISSNGSWENVSGTCTDDTEFSECTRDTDVEKMHLENGSEVFNTNGSGNYDDSFDHLGNVKDVSGMDQDYLVDASLEVNISRDTTDSLCLDHTNELSELLDESNDIEDSPEKNNDVLPRVEIPPFPDPCYERITQKIHPDLRSSKSEQFHASTSQHLPGKCRTMGDLKSNPSTLFGQVLEKTSSFPIIHKGCLEEPADSMKNELRKTQNRSMSLSKDSRFQFTQQDLSADIIESEDLELLSSEPFEVKESPGMESMLTPHSPMDSTSGGHSESLVVKKKKRRMKGRLSFILKNIREFPKRFTPTTSEQETTGCEKHQEA